jgi:hypothetical protein
VKAITQQTATDVDQLRVEMQKKIDEIMRSINDLKNNHQSRTQTLNHPDKKEEKRLSSSLIIPHHRVSPTGSGPIARKHPRLALSTRSLKESCRRL